jgi:ADP-ribose pyrophosphatase YjhB (NUDIX family)
MSLHAISEQNYIQQISIDCVIFGYQEKQLKVMIPKLIFKGDFWTLPSGFVYQKEDIDNAARRILEERTGIKDIYLEQFRVFGKAERSTLEFISKLIELNQRDVSDGGQSKKDFDWFTKRFISVGYYALVDINKVMPTKSELDESIEWYDIKDLPTMIIDFNEMVEVALDALRLNIDHKLTAFNLLPDTFTMKDVQEVYETIFDKPFARNNFQKKILDFNVLERLEKKFTGAANKAPYLYRLSRK